MDFELNTILTAVGIILYATYIFKRLSALATITTLELAVLHTSFFLLPQLAGRLLGLDMQWMFVLYLAVGLVLYPILVPNLKYGILNRRGFLRLVSLGKMHGKVIRDAAELSQIDVLVVNVADFDVEGDNSGIIDPRLETALKLGVSIETTPDFLMTKYGFIEIKRHISASQVVLKNFPIYIFAKTVAEKLIAIILFIMLLPVMVIVYVLIRIFDGAPVFFRQERIGKNGKVFKIWKFRTFDGNNITHTRFGGFLRQSHIDEFPQLVNVLTGEMALVGPRPEWSHLASTDMAPVDYWVRRTIKPGITGWAQVNYRPSQSKHMRGKKLGYDIYYINNCSVFLDSLIWLRTISSFLKSTYTLLFIK